MPDILNVNVKMAEEMGMDNIFIFGMTVEDVDHLQAKGYDGTLYYKENAELKQVKNIACVTSTLKGVIPKTLKMVHTCSVRHRTSKS